MAVCSRCPRCACRPARCTRTARRVWGRATPTAAGVRWRKGKIRRPASRFLSCLCSLPDGGDLYNVLGDAAIPCLSLFCASYAALPWLSDQFVRYGCFTVISRRPVLSVGNQLVLCSRAGAAVTARVPRRGKCQTHGLPTLAGKNTAEVFSNVFRVLSGNSQRPVWKNNMDRADWNWNTGLSARSLERIASHAEFKAAKPPVAKPKHCHTLHCWDTPNL